MNALSTSWALLGAVFLVLISLVSSHVKGAMTQAVRQPHIKVSLLSELDAVQPGDEFFVGLKLSPDKDWHTYWKNPGDSGLATNIQWELPEGGLYSEVHWPRPEKILAGTLANYGYHNEVVLPVKLSVPKNFKGDVFDAKAKASWLVCKETCIPGSAELALSLPVNSNKTSQYKTVIDDALSQVPKRLPLISGLAKEEGDFINIEIYAKSKVFENVEKVEFFAINDNLVEYSSPSDLRWKNNYLALRSPKSMSFHLMPKRLSGVLVMDDNKAMQFEFTL